MQLSASCIKSSWAKPTDIRPTSSSTPIIQTRAISSKANNESFTIMVSKSRIAAIKKAPDPNKRVRCNDLVNYFNVIVDILFVQFDQKPIDMLLLHPNLYHVQIFRYQKFFLHRKRYMVRHLRFDH